MICCSWKKAVTGLPRPTGHPRSQTGPSGPGHLCPGRKGTDGNHQMKENSNLLLPSTPPWSLLKPLRALTFSEELAGPSSK